MNSNKTEIQLPSDQIVLSKPIKIKQKRGPKPRAPLECPRCGYKCQLKCEFEKHLRRKTPCDKVVDHDYVMSDNKKKLKILIEKWTGLPKSRIFKKELIAVVDALDKLVTIMKNHDKDLSGDDKVALDEQIQKYRDIVQGISK